MIQGTDEWALARCGKATASRIPDLMARTKNGYGASRDNYMTEKVLERDSGVPFQGYVSKAMADGIEREPTARAAYEFYQGIDVEQVGFIDHPNIGMSGASPDGLIGNDGQIEIKCPLPATHLKTLLSRVIDSDYILQMQFGMACTGRQWCDFVSFHPDFQVCKPVRFDGGFSTKQLFVKRVPRDPVMIQRIEKEVTIFLHELDQVYSGFQAMFQAQAA